MESKTNGSDRRVRRAQATCEGLEDRRLMTGGMALPSFLGMGAFAQGGHLATTSSQAMKPLGNSARGELFFNARPAMSLRTIALAEASPGSTSDATVTTVDAGSSKTVSMGAMPVSFSGFVGDFGGNGQDVPWATLSGSDGSLPMPLDNFTLPFGPGGITQGGSIGNASDVTISDREIPAAVQSAMNQLEIDLGKIGRGAKATHAAVGVVLDDIEAIRSGTLTGDEAAAKLKVDRAAVLLSAGVDPTLIDSTQADEQTVLDAVASARAADEAEAATEDSTEEATAGTTTAVAVDQGMVTSEVPELAAPLFYGLTTKSDGLGTGLSRVQGGGSFQGGLVRGPMAFRFLG